ncbi:DMT family transporter [Egibacter rhizosphaerae]|uniref:DMT family transporter n=1 Tax=Egibacter rhizosphaerae TaxID=1670831 RepID=A0A411YH43_9ACTN|nr:DMT family transporter [Egibacter rhizosphaerae]QBI20429.1 DMT family transporter [Egibacter rhizosphaerae]
MTVGLGLLAAGCYGTSDFLGGLASRRAGGVFGVVLAARFTAVLVLLGLAPLLATGAPAVDELLWGGMAGLGGSGGVLLLYRGMVLGRMSVVAPVSAIGSSALPALVGVALGERPSALAASGVLLGIVAIALVSAPSGERITPRAIVAELRPGGATLYGLGAGSGFALVFVSLDQAGGQGDLWPILAAQAASLLVVAVAAGLGRRRVRLPAKVVPLAVVIGLLSVGAMTSFLFAARTGLLALVAVLTSLYPAVTVVLARVVLAERLASAQRVGVGLAILGVLLIGIG